MTNTEKEVIEIDGPGNLSGEVQIYGAKNSALKLMAAAILGQGESLIENVPQISDINIMCKVLEELGAKVSLEDHKLTIDTKPVNSFKTPYSLVTKMRASISVLGPLIGRFGQAKVAMPGGCQIGARKIDIHLIGLQQLGVHFEQHHGYLVATTPKGLCGANVMLAFPSVGATENVLMASVVASGTTVIENAAREPEIVDLCNMLNEMGAQIEGGGSPTITVHGVDLSFMHPCTHSTVGDRIEAGTFLAGAAATGGKVTVRGVNPAFLRMALMKLDDMGCNVETGENFITVCRTKDLEPIEIQTLPHPGFPTDLQAQFMLLAALANGNSVITENLFENRFMFAAELTRMGAEISIGDHHALISGPANLQGADVSAPDLRAGAALVLAGLVASGKTVVHDVQHIDRGYEDYVGKLQSLGAKVARRQKEQI